MASTAFLYEHIIQRSSSPDYVDMSDGHASQLPPTRRTNERPETEPVSTSPLESRDQSHHAIKGGLTPTQLAQLATWLVGGMSWNRPSALSTRSQIGVQSVDKEQST